MRRISAEKARPGMKLVRTIYDSRGYIIAKSGDSLTGESLTSLNIYGIEEVFIEDARVADVPVQPLIAPELEAQAIQAMRQLMTEHQGNTSVDAFLLDELERVGWEITRELFPEVVGEINTSGCPSHEDYPFVQPVKTAGLALLLGKRAGYDMSQLHGLVIAAMLKDVGHAVMPGGFGSAAGATSDEHTPELRQHPLLGAEIISRYDRFSPDVAEAVYQHHERWDGSGFSEGLRGQDTSAFARILAISDSFYDLVSARPERDALNPNEAVEYVMAYSGEFFDPELVQLLAANVPLYPSGVMVKLSTGESGVISRNTPGNFSRPVVRIFFNKRGRPKINPYDVDLAHKDYQDQLIVQILKK